MGRAASLEKTLIWGQEEKGMTEDEMVGWHEFEQAPGVGDGQGGLLQSMELQRVGYD